MDKNPNYTWFVYQGRGFAEADGIIITTAAELERSALAAIADGRCMRGVRTPTVYPISPVISFTPPPEQPHYSYLFFGSCESRLAKESKRDKLVFWYLENTRKKNNRRGVNRFSAVS
jgi:hypothetical protein